MECRKCLLIAAVVALTAAANTGQAQPQGSPVYCNETRSWFQLVHANKTWDEAFATARNMRLNNKVGRLAEPKSFAANDCILRAYGGALHGSWLGGLRERSQYVRPWFWASGGSFGYMQWLPGQPDNGGGGVEDRLCFWSGSGRIAWNDLSRNARQSFVVEFR